MAKEIVDKSCQSNFDKTIVRFWIFLSYLITTVPTPQKTDKKVLKYLFNKIEGTPILKLAMVKR